MCFPLRQVVATDNYVETQLDSGLDVELICEQSTEQIIVSILLQSALFILKL